MSSFLTEKRDSDFPRTLFGYPVDVAPVHSDLQSFVLVDLSAYHGSAVWKCNPDVWRRVRTRLTTPSPKRRQCWQRKRRA